jgi:cation transport ATPase
VLGGHYTAYSPDAGVVVMSKEEEEKAAAAAAAQNGVASRTGAIIAAKSLGGSSTRLGRFDPTRFDHLPGLAAQQWTQVSQKIAENQKYKPSPAVIKELVRQGKKKAAVDYQPLFPAECFPAFSVGTTELGHLCEERNRTALAQVLEQAVCSNVVNKDLEAGSISASLAADVAELCDVLKRHDTSAHHEEEPVDKEAPKLSHAEQVVLDHYAEIAASLFALVILRTVPEQGLRTDDATAAAIPNDYGIVDSTDLMHRRLVFGGNALETKAIIPFWRLCFDAVQDFVLMMLIVLGIIIIGVEVYHTDRDNEKCTTCWIDGTVIIIAVIIVVMVTGGIDYMKQFTFIRLTQSLHESNTKMVLRQNGTQTVIIDDDLVVGDILLVNSHSLATVPADCMVLGPNDGDELKMDEAALTGESKLISKKPGDIVLSGTFAAQGSSKLLVLAVGINSVAGKIKARVYEGGGGEDGDLGGEDEKSPLFNKIDALAQKIGVGGTFMAALSFFGSLIIGLGFGSDSAEDIVFYLITAITVLAVAVPEGLPLAVTLSLAFSSSKMMSEQNLVKHLDACETMGCATTICTDKTGEST